jgi:large subunit ribosomal protein L10
MSNDFIVEPAAAKIAVVAELRELVGKTEAAIFTDYRGMSVAELTILRKKLRAVDAEFHIVKNTLFKIAADGLMPVDKLASHLTGPTAIGFAKGDPVAPTKIIVDFMQDHKAMKLKAGVMGRDVFTVDQVIALSKTPPRDVLISQMLGSLNAPITGLVGTLNGIISNFVFTIQAIADSKGEATA